MYLLFQRPINGRLRGQGKSMWPVMIPNVIYYQHRFSSNEDKNDLEVGDIIAFEVIGNILY